MDEQPDQVPDLHRRASEWYEQNGERSDAIRHALAADDFERAAGLVELAARATLRSYRSARLLEWLRALPDDVVRTRPVLSTYYAFALLGAGELDAAEARLRDAERWLDGAAGEPPGAASARMVVADEEELRSVPGIIALAWAYLAQVRGDVATTRDRARRALDLMPESDHVWRGGAAVLLALTHWASGDLEEAQRVHDGGVASLERSGDISLAISAAYDGADLRKARGRLAEAGRTLRAGAAARGGARRSRHPGSGRPAPGAERPAPRAGRSGRRQMAPAAQRRAGQSTPRCPRPPLANASPGLACGRSRATWMAPSSCSTGRSGCTSGAPSRRSAPSRR